MKLKYKLWNAIDMAYSNGNVTQQYIADALGISQSTVSNSVMKAEMMRKTQLLEHQDREIFMLMNQIWSKGQVPVVGYFDFDILPPDCDKQRLYLASAIAYLRSEGKLTQEEMARRMDVTQPTVSNYIWKGILFRLGQMSEAKDDQIRKLMNQIFSMGIEPVTGYDRCFIPYQG